MKLLKLFVLCAWALACGGAEFDDLQGDELDELGEESMAFVTQQGGVTAGADPITGFIENGGTRAFDNSSGRVVVPGNNIIKYAVGNGLSEGVVNGVANAMNAPLGGARFTHLEAGFNLGIQLGTVSGASDNQVNHYVGFTCSTSPNALTENLPGIFVPWVVCTAVIDKVKVDAKGATAAEDATFLANCIRYAFTMAAGNGRQTLTGAHASSNNILPLNTVKIPYTAGELCRTNLFQAFTNPGTFNVISTGNCPPS